MSLYEFVYFFRNSFKACITLSVDGGFREDNDMIFLFLIVLPALIAAAVSLIICECEKDKRDEKKL